MGIKALQIPEKDADGIRWASVSFVNLLDTNEVLSGTPEVTEVGTSDLTIGNVSNNSGAMVINGESISANQAVRFTVTGGTAKTYYDLQVVGYTNSTPAQKIVADIQLYVS